MSPSLPSRSSDLSEDCLDQSRVVKHAQRGQLRVAASHQHPSYDVKNSCIFLRRRLVVETPNIKVMRPIDTLNVPKGPLEAVCVGLGLWSVRSSIRRGLHL